MKKKVNALVPAAAVLVILCAAYGFITWHQHRKADELAGQAEDSQIYVTYIQGLTSISWEKDGQGLAFKKEGDTWYLRAYIDKEGGISLDDCELISRKVSDWLDKEDFIQDSYILEVSSPGLGRPLKKDKDFARSIGKDVEIRLYKALNKSKEYTGILKAYDKESVLLQMEDGSDLSLLRADIALIRLALDF